MQKTFLILISVALVMLPGVALSIELVTNGGFETGDFSGWTMTGQTSYLYGEGCSIFPEQCYIITTMNVVTEEVSENVYSKVARLGHTNWSWGYLSQNLITSPESSYELSFSLFNVSSFARDLYDTFVVTWGGVTVYYLQDPVWLHPPLHPSIPLPAPTAETTLLQFGFRNDYAYWYLDDVSVTGSAGPEPVPPPLPEPSTMLLLGSGLLGLLGLRMKFK